MLIYAVGEENPRLYIKSQCQRNKKSLNISLPEQMKPFMMTPVNMLKLLKAEVEFLKSKNVSS